MDKVVDYLVYEQSQVRADRINRRLWILCIILTIFLFGTNAGWVYYENQFTDMTEISQEVDTGEGNATVIGIGDNNGKDQTDN